VTHDPSFCGLQIQSYIDCWRNRKGDDVAFWHLADKRGTATICPLLDNSGQRWILARDGLSAFDPTATLAVHCGNRFDAGFDPIKVLV
jgi:hypothetical protein